MSVGRTLALLVLLWAAFADYTRRQFAAERRAPGPVPIVLFDGVCGLCNHFIDFVIGVSLSFFLSICLSFFLSSLFVISCFSLLSTSSFPIVLFDGVCAFVTTSSTSSSVCLFLFFFLFVFLSFFHPCSLSLVFRSFLQVRAIVSSLLFFLFRSL